MSDPLPWLGKGIKIFGAVLFVVCAAALIWSLTRPAITHGPMPPEPAPLAKQPDAGKK
jgi:hypothetical protein